MLALAQLLPAPAICFTKYVIVVPRPLFAAALVERRTYLIVAPRLMPAAPRRYLAAVHRPLSTAPLVERRRYLIVVPRPMLGAPHRYLIVVPKPLPAAPFVVHRRYRIVAPGHCPRRRSLCVAGT